MRKKDALNFNLDEARYEELLKEGASYSKMIPVPAGAMEISVVLRDKPNGNLGSVAIPLSKYFPQASARKLP
ncbi:MAG TPA: hypothetical protein VN661_08520 [Candidatus Acidoferrales bacterium]|nr:hypothetical protein [Candidatus Acidoferrales bacterium]